MNNYRKMTYFCRLLFLQAGFKIGNIKVILAKKIKVFNPFKPNGFSNPCQLDESISNLKVAGLYISFLYTF